MALITALVAAAIPTALYTLILWWLDRYEKEPLSLLLIAFAWGAVPAIALAFLSEVLLAIPLERTPTGVALVRNVFAPIIEESLKALALLGLFYWARAEIDGPLDGIVYGALVGFGFSMTENALYFYELGNVSALLWVRGVAFGLNHAFFTSIVGLAVGLVRYTPSFWLRLTTIASGLGLAILFHTLHNYFAAGYATTGLVLSWLIQSGGVLVVLAVAVLSWRNERRCMQLELDEEVHGGLLTSREYTEVISSAGRLRSQGRVLFHRGWRSFRLTRQLHHLLTELAFCKSQQRLHDTTLAADEPDRLRGEIRSLRAALGEF